MYVGVESGSQKILDKINKNITIDEIIAKTALLNKYKVNWAAFFITGFPFETSEDIMLTKELILKIKPSFVSLNRFVPYPGTKIFNDYYINNKFKFYDLFQLNLNQKFSEISSKIQKQIEDLFIFTDEYNKSNALK